MTFKRLFVLLMLMRVEFNRRILGAKATPENVARLPSGTQYRVLSELGPDYVPTQTTGVVQRLLERFTDQGERLVSVYERTEDDNEGEYRVRAGTPVYRISDEPGVPRPAFRSLVPGLR